MYNSLCTEDGYMKLYVVAEQIGNDKKNFFVRLFLIPQA
jgi:hypothetical protein